MDSLRRHGVDTIFGYPGGAILPIYDALHIAESEGWVKHILVRHEQAGTHAADAYARATGKVGVCFGTSGPGATNLVTGIATAQMDSVPMVVITGQVPRPAIGTDAFQETDIFGITLPIVKHSWVGAGSGGSRIHRCSGVSDRSQWSSGAGADRYPEGCRPGDVRLSAG